MKKSDCFSIEQSIDHPLIQCSFVSRTVKEHSYEIMESLDLFDISNPTLNDQCFEKKEAGKRCFLVIDDNVYHIYGHSILNYFKFYNIEYGIKVLTVSEKTKTIDSVLAVANELDQFNLSRRNEPVIAIGGGVLTDICSLTANLYRRSTECIKIPTTLMGQIDAAIGVKTGINFNGNKNRLGTYYSSGKVLIDRTFLQSLGDRAFNNGLSEILKMALIKEPVLFELLEKHKFAICKDRMLGKNDYSTIIQLSIKSMLEELAPNLWEKSLERVVDFGHTFSPVLEMKAVGDLYHGEAVSIDMAYSVLLAHEKGVMSKEDLDRALNLFVDLGLPTDHALCTQDLLITALDDTCTHRAGKQNFPLPVTIGKSTFSNDITHDEIAKIVHRMKSLHVESV
ncbi:sedoheptulose 7-phosphate cyclase [uncultured Vibrio sp.]|uniref:sedoheptulose 7-phosphate cyclase n=1 Tax=uncultured Vibrio sp. TaxID=114054 RepID=UPI00261524CD|nr:sedoheptulose 7-phosphate cyclase [uncultured Vibrio sp.]